MPSSSFVIEVDIEAEQCSDKTNQKQTRLKNDERHPDLPWTSPGLFKKQKHHLLSVELYLSIAALNKGATCFRLPSTIF